MLTSLHIQRYQGWQDRFCRDIGAGWAKIVNPPLDTPILPNVPRTLIRFWCDDVAAGYISRGYEGGRQFVRDQAADFRRVQANGKVLELWNEPDCNTNEGLIMLREATLGAIDEANAQGFRLCVLNLAEANPHGNNLPEAEARKAERWKWEQLLDCINAAVEGGHYIGRHCYWRPDVEGPTGRYHALGRLKWDIDTLAALGVDVSRLKVLVNEWGIDGGIAGHTPQQGWRDLTTEDGYIAQVVEAEQYARGIPQIEALMLFTAGYEPPWDGFDHDEGFCADLAFALKAMEPVAPATRLLAPLRREDVVRITQRFTPPSHYGIDYSCYEGTPIYASCDGIAYRGSQPSGFGLYIRIEDGAGLYVYAAHLRAWAVADGALVQAGDLIGYSGNTGNSTGPHVHYEVRRAAPSAPRPTSAQGAIDPEPLLYWPEDAVPEPLPNDEQGPPVVLATKARWWCEQWRREHEAGNTARADAIHLSLIDLLYRLEGLL